MVHLIISREYPPTAYPPGGIGTYVRTIAHGLASRGETVHVIAQRWPGAARPLEQFESGRLLVHRVALDAPLALEDAQPGWDASVLAALPAVWLLQVLLTLGFTMLVAALAVIVRDIQHLMGVVFLFWFYLTPIFYEPEALARDAARWLAFNPLAAIVSAHREVTLYGRWPDWGALAVWSAAGAVLIFVSLMLFRRLDDIFIERT